ncbi:hypothetical protein M3231_17665 [Neobacillus mesonae]|nr:hypothetical protein [Neobacillus mesonae]
MKNTKAIISIITALMTLSLALNYFQWTTIRSYEKTMRISVASSIGLLGSDFSRSNDCLNNLLTDQGNKEVQFVRCYDSIMNASEHARELSINSLGEHSSAWNKIYRSLSKSGEILLQLTYTDQLDENVINELNKINKLTILYFDVIKKSNANTGYIDDQAMLKAEQAAQLFLSE